MSHQPLRKENDCLNCGTEVLGRFYHLCGQENSITHQGFWLLANHFVYDILHFDGKFFRTVGLLFSHPGFVAKEYGAGKPRRFLDPIRMHLFTSAVFFLAFLIVDQRYTSLAQYDPVQVSLPAGSKRWLDRTCFVAETYRSLPSLWQRPGGAGHLSRFIFAPVALPADCVAAVFCLAAKTCLHPAKSLFLQRLCCFYPVSLTSLA